MAGDWIPMRLDLGSDPAVIAVAEAVGLDEFAVVGRLHALWSWANQQSRNGHAVGVTVAYLNRYVQRDGFAEALAKAGWLSVTAEGITFPKFDVYNSKSAKKRLLAARRQAWRRVTQASRKASRKRHAASVTNALPREESLEESKYNTTSPLQEREEKSEKGGEEDPKSEILKIGAAAKKTAGALPFTADELAAGYNKWCAAPGALPLVTVPLSRQRAEKATHRIREHPEHEWWGAVFRRAVRSPFLRGENGAWKLTFDWLIANEVNAIKVLEGHYDHEGQGHGGAVRRR